MTPLAKTNAVITNSGNDSYIERNFDALYCELEKGIQSMKKGEVYTIEEAWEEIDKI